MFIVYVLFYFIQTQIVCQGFSSASITNVFVWRGQTANLTFNVESIDRTSILEMRFMNRVYFVGKKSAFVKIVPGFKIVENNLERFSFSLHKASKTNEGKYCLYVKDGSLNDSCIQLFIKQDKHPSVIINYEEGQSQDGHVNLICDAKWSTKPEINHPRFVYGWFKDGVYNTSTRQFTLYDEYIPKTRDIICVATDDDDCGRLFNGNNKNITLQKVKMDNKCQDVLGISKAYTQKSSYILKIKETANPVKEVIIGKSVTSRWTIVGNPKPSILKAFNKTHSGVGHRFVDVSMVKTATRHEYLITLTIPVISQYDLGEYCIHVKNENETLKLCQTLSESSKVSEQVPVSIIIASSVSFILVICLTILFIRVCKGKQPINPENISLSEVDDAYETVPDGDVTQSPSSRRSTPPLLRHTALTSTMHSENPRDDTSSSTSSDSSCNANKKERSSSCTNLSIIVNYSSDISKSSLTTNSSIESEVLSDYLNSYDQLDPQSQVSPTDNYQKLKL